MEYSEVFKMLTYYFWQNKAIDILICYFQYNLRIEKVNYYLFYYCFWLNTFIFVLFK